MIRIVKYEPTWVQQAIKEGKKPFFVQMPLKHYHKQGITSILGLGTAVERSRTGHKMSQKFVNKLKETSINKPLFLNHDPNQIAGKITGVKEGKSDEILPIAQLRTPNENPIVDAPRANIESLIQDDIPLGMSFGGTADDVKIVKESDGSYTYDVRDGELMEWSITPINAVKRSDGSVQAVEEGTTCGICQQIATQIKNGPNLPEINEEIQLMTQQTNTKEPLTQSTGVTLNQTAFDNALNCIEEGNVDMETPWNRGTYEWDNDDVNDLSTYCLGVDTTSSGSMDRYQYRIGMNDKLYKNAVISVAANSSAGSSIFNAADELLEAIYAMEKSTEPSTDGEVNEDFIGGNNMVENNEIKELKQMVSDLAGVVKQNNDTITQMQKAEADRIAEDERLKQEAAVKAEKDALIKDVTEANAEVVMQIIGPLLKTRDGLGQASLQQTVGSDGKPVDTANLTPEQIQQLTAQQSLTEKKPDYKDPLKSPAVWMGQMVKGGKTPAEMFNADPTYM